MPDYRIIIKDPNGETKFQHVFSAFSDVEAFDRARYLAQGKAFEIERPSKPVGKSDGE